MIAEFLAGIIVGAAATVMVAKWFDDRPKTKAKHVASHAALDMSAKSADESYQSAVARIFKNIEAGNG
jgi:hypothetical protein